MANWLPAVGLTLIFALASPAQANIMCDPGWVHGRATTVDLAIDFLQQMAVHHQSSAGQGAEARVCPKLEQFRMFVRGGCISAVHLPKVEALFQDYQCLPAESVDNG
ncbi:MAG: hypothetical protein WA921_05125 [Ahrensia sp.]